MLNDHIQAIFSYYSALCNALVMNGSTLLKDLPINQLNMGKKSSGNKVPLSICIGYRGNVCISSNHKLYVGDTF